MHYCYMDSPVGSLLLGGDADALKVIGFPEGKGVIIPGEGWVEDPSLFSRARTQLGEYFAGRRKTFKLSLNPHGTPFQLNVLDALTTIPFGETRTYAEIAEAVGRPRAVRAVGAANGRNPLPIVIPCHRVIGSDGSLTGFGGGLPAKVYLLELEGAVPQGEFFTA